MAFKPKVNAIKQAAHSTLNQIIHLDARTCLFWPRASFFNFLGLSFIPVAFETARCWQLSLRPITSSLYAQGLHSFTAYRHLQVSWIYLYTRLAFEVAWVLAALSQPNHIVPLCSGASFACRLHASSIPLGIFNEGKFHTFKLNMICAIFPFIYSTKLC